MEEIESKSIYTIAVTAAVFGFFAIIIFMLLSGLNLWEAQEIEFSVDTLAEYINAAKTPMTTTSQGIAGLVYPEDAFLIQLYFSVPDYERYVRNFEENDPKMQTSIGRMSVCIGRYVNFGCTGQYSEDPTPPILCPCAIGWPVCDNCEDRTTCSPEPSDPNHCLDWETCEGTWEEYPNWVDLEYGNADGRYFNDENKFFWYLNPGSLSFFESVTEDFFDGSEISNDEFIVGLDCRPIESNVPLVVHDDSCSTTDGSCSLNQFLWAHSTEGVRINNIVFRGDDDFIIMTRYDVQ